MTVDYIKLTENQERIIQKAIKNYDNRRNEKFKKSLVIFLVLIELIILLLIFLLEDNYYFRFFQLLTPFPIILIIYITILFYTRKSITKDFSIILKDINSSKVFQTFRIEALRVEKYKLMDTVYYMFYERNNEKVILREKDFLFDKENFPNDNFALIHEDLRDLFGNEILIYGKVLIPEGKRNKDLIKYFRKYGKPKEGEILYIED